MFTAVQHSPCAAILVAVALTTATALAQPEESPDDRLKFEHYFDLESVSDPQIDSKGKRIVYVRSYADIMTDRSYSNLWITDIDGGRHRPITTGKHSDSSPRWSHDGTRSAFVSNRETGSQIFVFIVSENQLIRLTNTTESPSSLTFSPDDDSIAFTMPVAAEEPKGVTMPKKPEGAEWAEPPVVIDKLVYRFNRRGYLPNKYRHIFVVPHLGGTPRQLTSGEYDHGAPSWHPDGDRLYFSATRKPEADWIVQDAEIYSVTLDGVIEPITDRRGPDDNPAVSPDGKWIAYTGFNEKNFSHTITSLFVMRADGSDARCITPDLDRSVYGLRWSPDSNHVFFNSGDQGSRNIYAASLQGQVRPITEGVQQVTQFTVGRGNHFAAIRTDPHRPGDVVTFVEGKGKPLQLTHVNDDILDHRKIGKIEEIRYVSSYDKREIQGWIVYPPEFDPQRKYPLILYIHGGPHAMYGVGFNFEFQAHAANDNVIFYCNPRGSTGYGEEFANSIQYNYPGDDYFDLMSGVDEVIKRGFVDEENMFVTGGSGGGVLTCWVIGRTERFAAAVSQYPVINWYSFVLTCDITAYVHKRWFKGYPWDALEDHMKRSPISLVGHVTTPTMLITGEVDWRTPISETEQYYQALKIQKKEAKMIRMPAEAHGVRGRPSHYIAKMLHIADWFESHKRGGDEEPAGEESLEDSDS